MKKVSTEHFGPCAAAPTDCRLTDRWPVALSHTVTGRCGETNGCDRLCCQGWGGRSTAEMRRPSGLVSVSASPRQPRLAPKRFFNCSSRAQRAKGWQRSGTTVNSSSSSSMVSLHADPRNVQNYGCIHSILRVVCSCKNGMEWNISYPNKWNQ
jgi:hypothetical protein